MVHSFCQTSDLGDYVLGMGEFKRKNKLGWFQLGQNPFWTLKIPMTKRTEFLGSLQPSQKIPNWFRAWFFYKKFLSTLGQN